MKFFEFDEVTLKQKYTANEPHSHDFYELYFLLDGEREFFVKNRMFKLQGASLVIVPPYVIHKTEGGPYKRININVSPDSIPLYLSEYLENLSKRVAIKITEPLLSTVNVLLSNCAKLQKSPIKNKNEILISVIQSLIFLLSTQNLPSIFAASATNKVKNISPDILKIIAYINANYNQPITLKTLSDKFYLSKVSLCKKFKKAMRCSIMDYVSHLRLNKAKSILRSQNKSMEEIAAECGYSSASYFYLTFKKQVGLSPSNYKKDQKIK